ncbi:beta-galactosidase BoGH2A-like [Corticium candelabrum]|uniref:beta-galactosidase BoGH2A-like n=1 Tax=Corticium candelabrum TaxID=121492 RepID=UPI002E25CDA8|nr:beta-galactosidase BoGH2A-like [Corticium candelabrum]
MQAVSLLVLCVIWPTSGYNIYSSDEAPPREDINFDFAWRFHLGDVPGGNECPVNSFSKNLSGVECRGLKKDVATTAGDCMKDCCSDVMCAIWQFSSASNQGCWMGQSEDCNHSSAIWVGGGRQVPAQPPPPAKNGPTSRDYDDKSWELVDAPHDGIISGTYSQTTGPEKHAYLPTNITWYRKHFNIPSDWKGKSIWVYFEGVFRQSTVYLNGEMLLYHDSGYTSFSVRLDNATNVMYGQDKANENVIAVRADATKGSGWWYEGGGIYRHNHLVSSGRVHLAVGGIYAASNVSGDIEAHSKDDPSAGMYVDTLMYSPSVEVVNDDDNNGKKQTVTVHFTLMTDEKVAASGASMSMDVSPGETIVAKVDLKLSQVELWSPARPFLYTLQTEVMVGSQVMDAVNTTVGFRSTHWDADTGFYVNNMPFKWRGFCDHNDFTGVGVAVPDRINLFRAQTLRAVGGNSWRMSHNPPIPVLLDILDRLGVVVWDENRQFGNDSVWVGNQRDMIRRDRNHPSVVIWSFCNEGGCMQTSGTAPMDVGNEFKKASKEEDTTRPVGANMSGGFGNGLTLVIEVQGFSHRSGSTFDPFHQKFPHLPMVESECCSCRTQRGEDIANKTKPNFGNFNGDCDSSQNSGEFSRKFVAGSMVWTLFDYYGEPTPYGWPMVSSSFGSMDLAGFPKASAFWYRSWWLYNTTNMSASAHDLVTRPARLLDAEATKLMAESKDHMGFMIHIVEHWQPGQEGTNRTIHAYTNAPIAELFVNGKSLGMQTVVWFGWAEWQDVVFAPGSLTAVALIGKNMVVANHTVETTGKAAAVQLHVDVPSEDTGTGTRLLLDGQDAGMVRASIVDSAGRVVPDASHNVTFEILSGPARIIGVGNGDPSCHEPNKATWRSAYHGLARVIVQTSVNHAASPFHRHRLTQIDAEGNILTRIVPPGLSQPPPPLIVVQATVEGLGSADIRIMVTVDADNHSVLSTAERWMRSK